MTDDDKALPDDVAKVVEKLRDDAAAYYKSVYSSDPDKMFDPDKPAWRNTLEYQWEDKPHRHVRDLSEMLTQATDIIIAQTEEIDGLNTDIATIMKSRQAILDELEQVREMLGVPDAMSLDEFKAQGETK